MDIQDRILWQVGAGDTERHYGDICLAHDVMIMGPGNPGPFDVETYDGLGIKTSSLQRFCERSNAGDLVLLRIGTGEVLALGEIVDDVATHQAAFADVDGWDLQHTRRVRWFPSTSMSFPSKTLGGQVATFAAVNVESVREWVKTLVTEERELERELKPLPLRGKKVSDQRLGYELFSHGLENNRITDLLETLSSIRRVAEWYWEKDEHHPSESETVGHLVVPLLKSLGWSQQLMAVEWNRLDIALFGSLPRGDENLECVVEAKLLNRSVFRAFDQAQRYARTPGRDNCTRLIVTDGIRYATYERKDDEFLISSYMNLLDMRAEYPIYKCSGCVETIQRMARWG